MSATEATVAAVFRAVQAATSLVVAHLAGVGFIMYMDLSGRWDSYALCTNRSPKTVSSYLPGIQSLVADTVFLFLPCLTLCLRYQADAIVFDTTIPSGDRISNDTNDLEWLYVGAKLVAGYVLGKVWAFGVHYILHHPKLYRYHKRHHQKPTELVASASWDDSYVEYAVMELPSFCITLLVFPNYWVVHLMHFALHGLDGAAGHSGFKAPGIMGT
mmetsp:Transcript_35547/g.85998  ORF Transcript_35547/g.85998 Transcript_35547/m.85998 type:complete len:215 (-) Transcript_35547:1369-2013(-)